MAAALVTREQAAVDSAVVRDATDAADVRLEVHDTSRLEWAVSVPLPRDGETEYAIELDLEFPAHVLAEHSPWDHLQELARLDGPDDMTTSVATIDCVRRFVVAVAAKMGRAHEGFARHARLVISPFATDEISHHTSALESWVHAAEHMLADARARLDRSPTDLELARESRLADEYLSLRFLELLAGSERALATVHERVERASPDDPCAKRFAGALPLVEAVGEAIAVALGAEMDHRQRAGYAEAEADAPHELERYLDRASQLKKHFQEVLFLESERFVVTDRFHHLVAAAVAIVASTWAFVGQLYLTRGSLSAKVSSSLIAFCVLAGLVYAVKDRIKEVGRTWFARNVHRFYAQRIAKYRAPAKTCPTRDVVVRARESFLRENEARPDPLNPMSGASLAVTTLRYRHQGTLEASRTLGDAGISRVKHVFRYDLSPLFARLDDATKPVPVFDSQMRRVRFAHAPRCYRVPVRLVVRLRGEVVSDLHGALVLHKRGLERIDLA
ncbi:MAG TPA: hypothetical protein VGH28_16140 [Polyangiaceae bacterium]|jgi:hypothetical protein